MIVNNSDTQGRGFESTERKFFFAANENKQYSSNLMPFYGT
jgi:hypothetical protein